LNAIHGCPHLVRISEQADHLKVCPANVITCTMSWNRGALARHDRPLFLAGLDKNIDGNYPGIMNVSDNSGISTNKIEISEISSRRTQHLDVALATRDQESLFKYIHTATEGSIWPICHNPYVHNLDAINVNSITERSMSENTRFTESMQSARLSESNGLTNSIDSLQAFENAYSSYMKSSNHSNSEYQDSSAQANSIQDNSIFDNSAFDNSDSVNNSVVLQDFSSSKNKIVSTPSISSTIHHPVPTNPLFWQRVDFRPKQFVSRGTDPMLEIPLNKQDTRNFVTQTTSDYSLLGPEACLYDVDFCERFFRMIGCDNIQHTFNPRWTRGHRTFEASAQTFPYPAVVLKTDILSGPVSAAPMIDSADTNLTQPPISNPRPDATNLRLGIGMIVESESDCRNKNKLRFICAQEMRRDEYQSHYKNVHGDIHSHLNGWFEQRCPFSAYGCTYSKVRLQPNGGKDVILHDSELGCFACTANNENEESVVSNKSQINFQTLPNYILMNIFSKLDSYTMNQMTKTSKRCRFMAMNFLHTKGIVSREWRKTKLIKQAQSLKVGGEVWRRARPKWKFSHCFDLIEDWKISEASLSMGDHMLNGCEYAKKARESFFEEYSRPIKLCGVIPEWSEEDEEVVWVSSDEN